MADTKNLKLSLLLLRYGVFIVFAMWTLDKFVNPEHAAVVFKVFYKIDGLSAVAAYAVGGLQAALVIAFALGIAKKWSYGAILLLHAVSTFSSYARYLDPWSNLLFFAAWPMLAATAALFLLRDEDTLFTIGR